MINDLSFILAVISFLISLDYLKSSLSCDLLLVHQIWVICLKIEKRMVGVVNEQDSSN